MKVYGNISSAALVVGLPFPISLSRSKDVCHIFTDVKGRRINGQLVDFNEAKGAVTIIRADNKIFRAPLVVFSMADQRYIREQETTLCSNREGAAS